MPRPSKLTPELHSKFVTLLRAGNTFTDTYMTVGVDRRTFERWIERGRKTSSGIYHDFYIAVTDARGEARSRWVNIMTKAAEKNWKAARWLLSCSDPENWGNKQTLKVEVQKDVAELLRAVHDKMSTDAYRELRDAIAAIVGSASVVHEVRDEPQRIH